MIEASVTAVGTTFAIVLTDGADPSRWRNVTHGLERLTLEEKQAVRTAVHVTLKAITDLVVPALGDNLAGADQPGRNTVHTITVQEHHRQELTRLLREIGVPAHLKGFNYLRDAILMVAEDQNLLGAITKTLYPTLALRYKTKWTKVERNIRHAIETAWLRGNRKVLADIFKCVTGERLTNSEFIATLADMIREGAQ